MTKVFTTEHTENAENGLKIILSADSATSAVKGFTR